MVCKRWYSSDISKLVLPFALSVGGAVCVVTAHLGVAAVFVRVVLQEGVLVTVKVVHQITIATVLSDEVDGTLDTSQRITM